MASSKVKGTNGKPLKKGTNRDKLMASVNYITRHGEKETKVVEANNGNPVVRTTHVGPGGKITQGRIRTLEGKESANPIREKRKNMVDGGNKTTYMTPGQVDAHRLKMYKKRK